MTILFADIVNFTSRAERTHPEPLVALLNTYMTMMRIDPSRAGAWWTNSWATGSWRSGARR